MALYLGMGWVAVIAAPALFLAVPAGGMIWVLGGGLLYTAGALIYALKRPNPAPGTFGFHELWHLFVVAGSVPLLGGAALPRPTGLMAGGRDA